MQPSIPGSQYGEIYQQPITSYGRGYGGIVPSQPAKQPPNMFLPSQTSQVPQVFLFYLFIYYRSYLFCVRQILFMSTNCFKCLLVRTFVFLWTRVCLIFYPIIVPFLFLCCIEFQSLFCKWFAYYEYTETPKFAFLRFFVVIKCCF